MTIGMPVVALATTELPTVIENGVNGFISCDPEELIDRMQQLIDDPELARRLGDAARQTARERFGFDRFAADWNDAFDRAVAMRTPIRAGVAGGTAGLLVPAAG
jgi:glycosyltransferase involved in cell wall biosynthesis